ncbi:U4/U6.U5 small nuclear ribonucleoprotein, partial [Coemansia sp. RSA 2559]
SRRRLARSGSPSPSRIDCNAKEGELPGEALQGMTEEEQMSALMGFSGFDTTKGKHVNGNDVGSANVKKQRKFRQYMNRKGGFNRLLDKQTI